MGIGSWLKGMFGAPAEAPAKSQVEPVEHKGFQIYPEPSPQGGQYRLQGRICKGEQEHLFIRADLFASADDAQEIMVRKAKLFIDQMGDGIFTSKA